MFTYSYNYSEFTYWNSLASTVRFNQSIYNVNESDGKIDVTLYHSNPSSVDITLRVSSDHVSTGKRKFDDDIILNVINV